MITLSSYMNYILPTYVPYIGFLDSPGKLNIDQVDQKVFSVSFDAPFSLENVPVQYLIEVSNSTNVIETIVTTQLQAANVTLLDEDNCNIYTVKVTSFNGLGLGKYQQESFILYEGK